MKRAPHQLGRHEGTVIRLATRGEPGRAIPSGGIWRFSSYYPPSGSYPETGFEEVWADFTEPGFYPLECQFSIPRAQHAIQIKGCTDQRKVGKCLREIAECLALPSGLLRVKPEMVGIAQHALEQQPGLIQSFGNRLTCTR